MISRLNRFFVLAGTLLLASGCGQPWDDWPAGRMAPYPPIQTDMVQTNIYLKGDWQIRTLAQIELEALLLSREPYWVDATADISPVDFALGWGGMSDPAVLRRLNIWQAGRFMFYEYDDGPPIPSREIIESSANMHLIPATEAIADAIADVRPGDVVRLRGKLVEASTERGNVWRSSLTRTDTGDGACEVVWVEHIEVVG